MKGFFIALVVLSSTRMALCAPVSAAPERVINSFENAADVVAMQGRNARVSAATRGVTAGKQALQIEFDVAQWPNAQASTQTAWDWSGFSGLAMDVTNPTKENLSFSVRVDDDPSADGNQHCRTGSSSIEAGKTATFLMPFGKSDPMSLGVRGLPAPTGMIGLGANGSGEFGWNHIVAWQIFMQQPSTPKTLLVDNIRLVTLPPLDKMIDRFGQYTGADWPGKLKKDDELVARRTRENALLSTHPALADRDKWGGWSKGPQLPASRFFRTAKVNDKWWLVTPDGRLFFSAGIDCVQFNNPTFTSGRESWFTWLPAENDALAHHTGYEKNVHSGPIKEGKTFDFFAANLERKYGPDYKNAARDIALRRLPAWGFNTIGNWSDGNFYGNSRLPYVVASGVWGNHARLSSGSDYWGRMHDPFDPQFAVNAANSLREVAAKVKDDPYCIGYFVDNELSWGGSGDRGRYGLAYGALSEATTSPAKQEFLRQLRAKYGDITKLNAAWQTGFATWTALEAPQQLEGVPNEAMKADMGVFVNSLALKYFQTVRDELKKLDPNHLYLGCRFAWSTREAVDAAAQVCDVVSFNIYKTRIDANEWSWLGELNKPCIIGEFHFGALDRGMFHPGLVSTPNQKARATMYEDYVRSVLDHPAFVGCHWFQYIDEPTTGRTYDGENYNIGFVNATDTPYPEMVAAAQKVHSEMYTRRYVKK
ncbi:MAG TPA: beta-galactosidase [Abditibacteriaceae bacterium]|jgi:hypothetical protein